MVVVENSGVALLVVLPGVVLPWLVVGTVVVGPWLVCRVFVCPVDAARVVVPATLEVGLVWLLTVDPAWLLLGLAGVGLVVELMGPAVGP